MRKIKKRLQFSFRTQRERTMQSWSNRVLTSTPEPQIEDKDLAPQLTSSTRMDTRLALLPTVFVIQNEIQIPGRRKLTFSSNKFTVMKIHNRFDLLFQHVSTIDRDG